MRNVSFMAPGSELELAQQDAQRQQRLAEALRQQSMTPTQGVQAGQMYVAPSWTQGLARMLQAYQSNKLGKQAEEGLRTARGNYDAKSQADIDGFIEAFKGAPAKTIQPLTPNDDDGNPMPVAEKPAVQADPNAALRIAMQSQNPMIQQAGGSILSSMMPKGAKWEKVEKPNPDGSKDVGYVDINSPNPWSTFQAGGTAPVQLTPVNGQFANPVTGAPVGAAIPKQLDPTDQRKDLLIPDGNGGFVPNRQLVGVKKDIAKSGASQVSVDARNYNTQESEQSKEYGKSLGKMRSDITQAGYDAPKKIAQLDRMEQLLAGIDGGGAAPAMAEIASVAQSLGIKIDPKLGNKQAAEALSREMAGGLRQPGTGPMTDKDFDNFLKQVPSLSKTAEGRAQITKTLRASIERDARAAQFGREYAKKNKGVIDDNFFDAVSDFYAKNPIVSPAMPATNARGMAFDGDKEKRYQDWLKSQGQK